jgi:uncharacterized membrane protein YcaP (DUF421 family)
MDQASTKGGLELLVVATRTAVVLASLLFGIRVAGRRHLSEANVHDILVVLLVANAVQNAMTKGSGRLTVALVSAATLLAAGWLTAPAFGRRRLLGQWLGGTPTLLVHDGTVLAENLRKEQLTEDEVATAARKQGLSDLSKVKLAVLETNGSISVVPR